jgi:hypothetical protein
MNKKERVYYYWGFRTEKAEKEFKEQIEDAKKIITFWYHRNMCELYQPRIYKIATTVGRPLILDRNIYFKYDYRPQTGWRIVSLFFAFCYMLFSGHCGYGI